MILTDKKVVLLVDDDPLILQTYQTEFELSGFEVIKASDGQNAIRMAKENKPSVILLDILMPVMSGLEVLKKLKEDSEISEIPVFTLTNIGQEEAIQEALDSGAADFILKYRFSPAEVVEKVKKVLDSKS